MVLLLAALGLTAVLTYEALMAARSHRATAANTVRDYATFAAWEYASGLERFLEGLLYVSLRPFVGSTRGSGPDVAVPHPSELDQVECNECPLHRPSSYFRLDLGGRILRINGDSLAEADREWLVDTLSVHARRTYQADWLHASVLRDDGDGVELVVYRLQYDEEGEPRSIQGMTTELERLRPVFRRVEDQNDLLPPSLTGGASDDSLLAVEVDVGGSALYRSSERHPTSYAATASLDPQFGGIRAEVAIRPDAAERLVIGGLPRSRLPMLIGISALAFILVLVAVGQLRRQQELTRIRADFVSSTSHELSTPLAQIRMFAETLLLDRVRSEEERRHALEIITKESRRLTHLVRNILQFSKLERHESRIDPEACNVSELVDDVIQRFDPIARSGDGRVQVELADRAMASVDPDAFRQILLNLLDNAVKYGPAGQAVTVGTSVVDDHLRLWVDDEGPGVPPEERDRIWESFSRLERDAGSEVAGSGIGLAVVRRLIEAHGGRAWVEDAPSGGARFIVEMPDAWREAGDPSPYDKSAAGSPDVETDARGATADA